jgi:transcriptional regulator with XRE-family HTH domain
MSSESGQPSDHVGRQVRRRRQAAGLSIAEVARRADVSAPFISQLEAGRTSMSIATLYRVAAALGCTANALLGPDTGHDAVPDSAARALVTRAGGDLRFPAGAGEHTKRARLLSRIGGDVGLEAYHYVMRPGDPEQEWFEHGGEDFVYVIAGTVVIEFGDGESVTLGAGDSLHHDGTVPHRWILEADVAAEVLGVIHATPTDGEFTQP